MPVREVLKMGDPRLLQTSVEVDVNSDPELDTLIEDMFDTMKALDGAGLAAPQIGVMKRVVIFEVEHNPRYPQAPAIPRTILINPEIEYLTGVKDAGWEGCLSVPGMRGLVERYSVIRYRGIDSNGDLIEREAQDFHARVVQHEVDHLNGVLYPMRVRDMRNFGFEDTLFPSESEDDDE